MKMEGFLELVPATERSKIRPSTLGLWHRIYSHIEQAGSADTVDDEKFVRAMGLSVKALARHLRKLANMGLIEAHELRYCGDPLSNAILGGMSLVFGRPATRFRRYTLPGKPAPLQYRSGEKIVNDVLGGIAKGVRRELRKRERRRA